MSELFSGTPPATPQLEKEKNVWNDIQEAIKFLKEEQDIDEVIVDRGNSNPALIHLKISVPEDDFDLDGSFTPEAVSEFLSTLSENPTVRDAGALSQYSTWEARLDAMSKISPEYAAKLAAKKAARDAHEALGVIGRYDWKEILKDAEYIKGINIKSESGEVGPFTEVLIIEPANENPKLVHLKVSIPTDGSQLDGNFSVDSVKELINVLKRFNPSDNFAKMFPEESAQTRRDEVAKFSNMVGRK